DGQCLLASPQPVKYTRPKTSWVAGRTRACRAWFTRERRAAAGEASAAFDHAPSESYSENSTIASVAPPPVKSAATATLPRRSPLGAPRARSGRSSTEVTPIGVSSSSGGGAEEQPRGGRAR